MENVANLDCGKIVANVEIDLNDMVVTYRTVTRVLMSVIEFLSFNRHQIPMVFETFTHLTTKLENLQRQKSGEECAGVKNFALERQRELAINTNRNFRDINDIIAKACKQYEIEQAIVCFGATVFTLKEAFVVNLPRISKRHTVQNHVDAPQMITRKVIMSIISNSNFFEANSNDLKATNMFLFIKPRHLENHPSDVEFELHEDITFPSTCRTTVLNIENPMENMSLNCCKNLNVYNDMLPNAEKSEEDITKAHTGMSEMTANLSSYFICKVCVKGFKDQLVKGTSIWTI